MMDESPEQESRPIDAVPLLAWLKRKAEAAEREKQRAITYRRDDEARCRQVEVNVYDRVHVKVEEMAK